MPKVYNKYHKDAPPDAVYIGRGSLWGNPYVIGPDGDRKEVIEKYEKDMMDYLYKTDGGAALLKAQLKGKDLVCFCAPKACHGDILLKIANEE